MFRWIRYYAPASNSFPMTKWSLNRISRLNHTPYSPGPRGSGFLTFSERPDLPRPTLRTIADKLGVSTATVSLAMRDSAKISPRTRERVKAALTDLGYVYQRSAAGLRTSRTHTVGVIVNNISDPFFSTLLASLEHELAKAGRTVFLCNTNESVPRQTEFIRRMSEYSADGIIVSPAIGSAPEDFNPALAGMPPLVFVSRSMSELRFDYVIAGDYAASRLAMRHLIDLGHRRIALIGGDPSVVPFKERVRGYRESLDQAGIEFDPALIRSTLPNRLAGFEAAQWISELKPRPSAAACYNDAVALGLMAGLQRTGLYPGKNFALVGHGDVEEASMVNPGLTVTAVSRDEMGRKAAATLIARMENPECPPERVVLTPKLIVRESSAFRVELSS